MTEQDLPEGFAALEHFVSDWSLGTALERDAQRGAKSADQRQQFYDAFTPRLGEALARLDQTPLNQHDEAETKLMRMALSYAHVAQAIEVQGPDEDRHARSRKRLLITSAPADH
ncbi:hypothetical protein [Erythrobacter alti]|uniref:hypothetical protein n=1 Tax=Erythrobacter alti TaxID=1896145 RepID=UPI0030F3EA06